MTRREKLLLALLATTFIAASGPRFVDLVTAQTIAGAKTWSGAAEFSANNTAVTLSGTTPTISYSAAVGSLVTTSSASGANLSIASGANAAGEYGVTLGTTADVVGGVPLVGFAELVNGTPNYFLEITTLGTGGSARVTSVSSVAGQNLALASTADAADEYGVVAGSNLDAADGTQLFAVGEDLDGTPAYVFTVLASGAGTFTGGLTVTTGAVDFPSSAVASVDLACGPVSANTASTCVLRDGSGNFSAGTITAALSGNATTATALAGDPADCGANAFATAIAASGALTCAQPAFTDISGTATAAQVADVVDQIDLPLGGWIDGVNALPLDASGADAEPDFTTGFSIEYDTGDTNEICTTFMVPTRYVSGGTFTARITQQSATVTQIENWRCAVSQNAGALGSYNSTNLANQTGIQSVTVTPVVTYAAGDAIGVCCKQGNATADDNIDVFSIRWNYTGSQ